MDISTKVVPFNSCGIERFDEKRLMSREEFLRLYATGTLARGMAAGMLHTDYYWSLRVAKEFGYQFMMVPASRVCLGPAVVEPDSHPHTEFVWHFEDYTTGYRHVFEEDKAEAAYVIYEDDNGDRVEGLAIVITETSLSIPKGRVIFALLTEFDRGANKFLDTITVG